MFAKLLSRLKRKKVFTSKKSNSEIVDIFGRPIEDALEYFYPRQIKGIPVFSVDSIYDHYSDKIKEIINASGIGDHRINDSGHKVLDELFTSVIKRYVEYVHMLPASENHHHSTPGGLLVHSLEASRFAQRHSKEIKPPSMGMIDLDRQSLPVYRYAAWLAALMHDAGKVLCDMVVDAVDIERDGTNVKVSNSNPIPSWQPQKESLISWAKRFNVATYSVTYLKNRMHNKHNSDAAQLLQPVIGAGSVLTYLLSSPADVHSQLVRVLSGYDNGKDYIAAAVRKGDMLSTSRNVATLANSHYISEQQTSTPTRVFRAMKMAKGNWEYNRPNAHVWVIGGEVYFRYQKTFYSIINTAKKNDLVIPHEISTIITIMEDNGIIEKFDNEHKSIKFTPGIFTEKQITDILQGRQIVPWEEFIKVKWKRLVFDDEIMPDSSAGLIFLSNTDTILEVDEFGVHKEFKLEDIIEPDAEPSADNETAAKGESDSDHESTPASDSKQPAAKGESDSDHESTPASDSKQPAAKGESDSDHESTPASDSKQPAAKGESDSDHESTPASDSKQPAAKGESDSDHESTPASDSKQPAAKGESNSDHKSTPANDSKETSTKPKTKTEIAKEMIEQAKLNPKPPLALKRRGGESTSESVSEPASEPVSESVSEPTSESASEPASESTSEPVSESASEPVSESVSDATTSTEQAPKKPSKSNQSKQNIKNKVTQKMSGWPLETISSSGKLVFIDINYVLKHYDVSDRKVAIEKLDKDGLLKKVDGKPNIKAATEGDKGRILIEVVKQVVTKRKPTRTKAGKQPGAKGESNSDHKSTPANDSKQPGAKGKSNSDHKSTQVNNGKQPGAKGESNSDHKSTPANDSKQPGAKGKSNSDHKSTQVNNGKQPGAKGESNSDHKSTPANDSKQPGAKGKSNSDHKSTPANDIEQVDAKPNEDDNDFDINGVDYGLKMRVGKSTKGTVAHWIKEYYESPLPNKPASKFVTEAGGETIIQAAWFVEFINKKSGSKSKVFLRHVLNELQSSGFKVSLNPESNCFHIDSTKINEMYLEIS